MNDTTVTVKIGSNIERILRDGMGTLLIYDDDTPDVVLSASQTHSPYCLSSSTASVKSKLAPHEVEYENSAPEFIEIFCASSLTE